MRTSEQLQVQMYIETHHQNKVILLKDLQVSLKHIKKSNLRQILRRLVVKNWLIRPYQRKGAYIIGSDRLGGFPLENILNAKYVFNEKQQRIGFLGGINFVNSLGLTTQTSPVIYVFSKSLSHPKRMVKYGNYRVMLIKVPKTLDLSHWEIIKMITHIPLIERLSNQSLAKTTQAINDYVYQYGAHISKDDINQLIKQLPMKLKMKAYEYEINQLSFNQPSRT
jgi:hypothetical protein